MSDSANWICRQCGCSEEMACNHADMGPCWWAYTGDEENGPLCSHCVMEQEGELEAGSVERPWKEELP